MDAITAKILSLITDETEMNFLQALREYYRQNFRNGESDEAFVMWIEASVDLDYVAG